MPAATVLAVATFVLAAASGVLGPGASALAAAWIVAAVAGGIVAVTEARRRRAALIALPVRADRRRRSPAARSR